MRGLRCAAFASALLFAPVGSVQSASTKPIILCDPKLIFFDANSSVLDARALALIRELAAIGRERDSPAYVGGHADADEINPDELALRRAETIKAELARNGVIKDGIRISGFGSRDPLVPEPRNEAGHAQNRRADISICRDP